MDSFSPKLSPESDGYAYICPRCACRHGPERTGLRELFMMCCEKCVRKKIVIQDWAKGEAGPNANLGMVTS